MISGKYFNLEGFFSNSIEALVILCLYKIEFFFKKREGGRKMKGHSPLSSCFGCYDLSGWEVFA